MRLVQVIEACWRLCSIGDSGFAHPPVLFNFHVVTCLRFLLVWCCVFIFKMRWRGPSSVAALRVFFCLAIVTRGVEGSSKGPCRYIIRVCEEETRSDESHPWGGSAFFTQSDGALKRHLLWPAFSPPFLPTADPTNVVLPENWSFGDNWKHSSWVYEGKAESLPLPNTTEDMMKFLLVGRNLDEFLLRSFSLHRVLPEKLYDNPPDGCITRVRFWSRSLLWNTAELCVEMDNTTLWVEERRGFEERKARDFWIHAAWICYAWVQFGLLVALFCWAEESTAIMVSVALAAFWGILAYHTSMIGLGILSGLTLFMCYVIVVFADHCRKQSEKTRREKEGRENYARNTLRISEQQKKREALRRLLQ